MEHHLDIEEFLSDEADIDHPMESHGQNHSFDLVRGSAPITDMDPNYRHNNTRSSDHLDDRGYQPAAKRSPNAPRKVLHPIGQVNTNFRLPVSAYPYQVTTTSNLNVNAGHSATGMRQLPIITPYGPKTLNPAKGQPVKPGNEFGKQNLQMNSIQNSLASNESVNINNNNFHNNAHLEPIDLLQYLTYQYIVNQKANQSSDYSRFSQDDSFNSENTHPASYELKQKLFSSTQMTNSSLDSQSEPSVDKPQRRLPIITDQGVLRLRDKPNANHQGQMNNSHSTSGAKMGLIDETLANEYKGHHQVYNQRMVIEADESGDFAEETSEPLAEEDDKILMSQADDQNSLDQEEIDEQYRDINYLEELDRRATNHVHAIDGHSKSMLNDIHRQRTIEDYYDENEEPFGESSLNESQCAESGTDNFQSATSFITANEGDIINSLNSEHNNQDKHNLIEDHNNIDRQPVVKVIELRQREDEHDKLSFIEELSEDQQQFDQRVQDQEHSSHEHEDSENFKEQNEIYNEFANPDSDLIEEECERLEECFQSPTQDSNDLDQEQQFIGQTEATQLDYFGQPSAESAFQSNEYLIDQNSTDALEYMQEIREVPQIYEENLYQDQEYPSDLHAMDEPQIQELEIPVEGEFGPMDEPKNDMKVEYEEIQKELSGTNLPRARIRWISAVNKIVNRVTEVSKTNV